jgi:hypothetical protein
MLGGVPYFCPELSGPSNVIVPTKEVGGQSHGPHISRPDSHLNYPACIFLIIPENQYGSTLHKVSSYNDWFEANPWHYIQGRDWKLGEPLVVRVYSSKKGCFMWQLTARMQSHVGKNIGMHAQTIVWTCIPMLCEPRKIWNQRINI